MSTKVRFPELDLLRFFAACAVMLFHYTFRGPAHGSWPASFPVLGQISRYGYLGVNVFFVLSGFVILLTAYEKNAIGFSLARFVRLYPAYWICVTLTALALLLAGNHAHITPRQYFANLTMIHGYFGIRDVSGVYWSLAVELKFYFLIFLLLFFGMIRRLRYFLGGWLVASILLSLREPHGIANFFLFPEWSSYFIAGATLFLIHREGLTLYKLGIVVGCYGLSIGYAIGLLPMGAGSLEPETRVPVLVSLITLFYLVFLAIALRKRPEQHLNTVTACRTASSPRPSPPEEKREKTLLPARGIVAVSSNSRRGILEVTFYTVGLITYPLYLLHQDLGYVLLRAAPPALNRYLLLFAVMVMMVALSWLVTFGPERWLASRLKTFVRRIGKAPLPRKSLMVAPVASNISGVLTPIPLPISSPPSEVESPLTNP